jgi:hypothetical protein
LELEAGQQDRLDDAQLDAYYQKIRLLTQGALFSAERWAAIWELNTRSFDELMPGRVESFRFPNLQTAFLETVASNTEMELNLNFAGQGSAAQVDFPEMVHNSMIELALSAGDNFLLVYLDIAGDELGSQLLLSRQIDGIEIHSVSVPRPVAASGFAGMRLVPIRFYYDEADGRYLLATLRLTK